MDFKINPFFRARKREEEIFYRIQKFSNLCRKLAYETQLGKPVTIKYMKKVMKYTPIQDAPEVNALFNLISETIFAMHEARVNEGGITPSQTSRASLCSSQRSSNTDLCSSQRSSNTDKNNVPKPTKYKIFDDKTNFNLFKQELELLRKLRETPQRAQTMSEQLARDKLRAALAACSMHQVINAAVGEGVGHLLEIAYICGLDNGFKRDMEAVEYSSDTVATNIVTRLHTPSTGTSSHNLIDQKVQYVRSNINRQFDRLSSALDLVKDMKIRQVVGSDNGTLAFGWTRPCFGAPKVYGFYTPFNTTYISS